MFVTHAKSVNQLLCQRHWGWENNQHRTSSHCPHSLGILQLVVQTLNVWTPALIELSSCGCPVNSSRQSQAHYCCILTDVPYPHSTTQPMTEPGRVAQEINLPMGVVFPGLSSYTQWAEAIVYHLSDTNNKPLMWWEGVSIHFWCIINKLEEFTLLLWAVEWVPASTCCTASAA